LDFHLLLGHLEKSLALVPAIWLGVMLGDSLGILLGACDTGNGVKGGPVLGSRVGILLA
jgi:hypothetical protein